MEINKVKIVEGATLSVLFTTIDAEGKKAKHAVDYESPVHPDLKLAFKRLDIHFGLLTESVETSQVPDINSYDSELTEKLHVTSFSKGGKEDDPGIVLSGHKILKTGKAMIMNCPFTRFNESDESGYKYIDHLQGTLNQVEIEVEAYLDGKHAEDPQPELPFPDENVTHAQIVKPYEELTDEEKKEILKTKNAADPEAMARVAEWDHTKKDEAAAPKAKSKKKGRQTPQNPSGSED